MEGPVVSFIVSKVCITCGLDRPLDEFWGQPSKVDGRQAECKNCQRQRNRQWWKANRSQRTRDANRAATNRSRRMADPCLQKLRTAKYRAKVDGIEFSLLPSDVVIPETCPALGIKIQSGMGHGRSMRQKDMAPSIDRIDNTLGYVSGNVIVVSYRANRLKSDATIDELRRIVEFYDRLQRGRIGKSGVLPPLGTWLKEVSLPSVQSSSQEETRPLFVGDD